MSGSTEEASTCTEITRIVVRELNEQMAQYHEAIAERLGLTLADHKAFDLVCKAGPLTAGQLAQLTNLTSGAVTGLVDRLEHAGVVRRERDLHDRRRVMIQPSPNAEFLTAILDSLSGALMEACSRYTEQELTTVIDFTQRIVAIFHAETARLQQEGNHDEEDTSWHYGGPSDTHSYGHGQSF
jgi:DNA-binding MarR family transcriptional regulator